MVAEIQGDATTGYLRGVNLISKTADTTEYYLYNAHGDVVNLTNPTGTVTKTYDYDAFGNERNPDTADENPFRYCGEYWNVETGAYYLRARYYDPLLGRFTTEDPALAGLNWYTYCTNNPVGFVDPLGLVEVSLREYAKTYEGSVVQWNAVYGIAYVHYGDKTLTVKSTSENNRDGWIFVDDSLFIETFGVGDDFVVYHDPFTGNVSIRAPIAPLGETAFKRVPGSESQKYPYGMFYYEAFLEGVMNFWTTSFGGFSIATYCAVNYDGIPVHIIDDAGVCNWDWVNDYWSYDNPGIITLYTSHHFDRTRTLHEFMAVSAHEFGHALGVEDAYKSKTNPNRASIFNDTGTPLTSADVLMVLKALRERRRQAWP